MVSRNCESVLQCLSDNIHIVHSLLNLLTACRKSLQHRYNEKLKLFIYSGALMTTKEFLTSVSKIGNKLLIFFLVFIPLPQPGKWSTHCYCSCQGHSVVQHWIHKCTVQGMLLTHCFQKSFYDLHEDLWCRYCTLNNCTKKSVKNCISLYNESKYKIVKDWLQGHALNTHNVYTYPNNDEGFVFKSPVFINRPKFCEMEVQCQL